jgi:presenilin 1
LVSKAAQYSFATFASCTLVILAGLGGTLVLLSVYHTALPALPISIFLGVTFYFLTKTLIEPYSIEAIMTVPVYV